MIEEIAVLVVALFNFFLGFTVLFRNKKALINRIFFLLEIDYALWSLSLFFYQYPIIFSSFIWIKITYLLVVGFILNILAFSFVFPIQVTKRAFVVGVTLAVFYLAFTVWMLFFTPWFVTAVVFTKTNGLQSILGPGYIWWSIATWFPLVFAAINFIVKSSQVTPLQKIQMRYFWIGFTLFGIFICIPDVIIPLVWHTTHYFFISPIANLIFSGTVAYIILRHRFLDIRRIVVRAVSKAVILFCLGAVYFLVAYAIGILFFPNFVNIFYIITTIFFALFLRIFIQPTELQIEKKLQKFIKDDYYEREDVLNAISKIITTTLDFKELTKKITKEISNIVGFSQASILLIDTEKKILHFYFSSGERISPAPKIYLELIEETKNTVIVTDEMPGGLVKSFFVSRKVGLCVPLNVEDKLFGYLVIYRKTSGNVFTTFDVKTIELIAPQISIALQNAQHVSEIENFNKYLRREVKKATEALVTVNKRLVELDKEKDDFISMASHELRTPTTVIKTFLWILLKREKTLVPHVKQRIEKLYNLSHFLGEMIKELLDISMLESGKMQFSPVFFDLAALTKDVIDGVKATTIEQKQITMFSQTPVMVFADKAKIHQVIENLITNAIKYTPENGKIEISFTKKGKFITTAVADNGAGIAKRHREKLFTKFGKVPKKDSSDKEIPGSGLGLFICKKIIEQSGGSMWVTSTVGKGSTFYFTLPSKK